MGRSWRCARLLGQLLLSPVSFLLASAGTLCRESSNQGAVVQMSHMSRLLGPCTG